jgi:hypothetical protein
LTKFFEKFDGYPKNKIWLGGDSSTGDFLPNVVNVMHDLPTHRDVFDRVVGVINEGPELSGAADLWQMPIGYRMFNLISKKDHRKILKKFKSRAENLGQKTWQKFFHDFEIALGEKIARPRYSPQVVDYYDIRDFIPFVVSKYQPKPAMVPGLDIYIKTMNQGAPFDLQSRKVEASFHAPRRDSNGNLMKYTPFAWKVMNAHWKWYYGLNLKKQFKKFLGLGYKYVSYYGEYDMAGNIQTWDEYIKMALGDERYEEYKLAGWKKHPRLRYVQKDFENTRTCLVYSVGHVVGMDKPWTSFDIVKRALQELTPKDNSSAEREGSL